MKDVLEQSELSNLLPSVFYMSYLFDYNMKMMRKQSKEEQSLKEMLRNEMKEGAQEKVLLIPCYSLFSVFVCKLVAAKYMREIPLRRESKNGGGSRKNANAINKNANAINKRDAINVLRVPVWKKEIFKSRNEWLIKSNTSVVERKKVQVEKVKVARALSMKGLGVVAKRKNAFMMNIDDKKNREKSWKENDSKKDVLRDQNRRTPTVDEISTIMYNSCDDNAFRIFENVVVKCNNEQEFRNKLFMYYNLREYNNYNNQACSLIRESQEYGMHIQIVIANKLRCSGIQVLEAIRIYRGNFTSRPDGLCYLPCLLKNNPEVSLVPLEIKSNYIVGSSTSCVFSKAIPFSHLFQMLSHCSLHNSPIAIYICYHRPSGSHKVSLVYDESHKYWKSIVKILDRIASSRSSVSLDMKKDDIFCELKSDTSICSSLHCVIDLIKQEYSRFTPLLKHFSQQSLSPKLSSSTTTNSSGSDQSRFIYKDIEEISNSCDVFIDGSTTTVINIAFYNNINAETSIACDSNDDLHMLSPPYNDLNYWLRISKFIV